MLLSETVSYGGATPGEVFELISDEAFRGEMCEKVHAISHDVKVERSGDDTTVTIKRTMPADMPDFVKKLVGETVEVVQTETWGGPAADGTRSADVHVNILGQPAEMVGTSTLRPTSEGTELAIDGDVKVKIPFLGKTIEPEIAKAIAAALRTEAKEGIKRLG